MIYWITCLVSSASVSDALTSLMMYGWHRFGAFPRNIVMSWLTILGVLSVVLGIIAYVFECPYGVHIGVVGVVITVVSFFVPRRGITP